MTTPPADPPTSGPAVELPPHGEKWRPKVTVYDRRHGPLMWIYLETGWVLATIRARHDHPNGLVAYQAEHGIPNDNGTSSRVSRTYAWSSDNMRPA